MKQKTLPERPKVTHDPILPTTTTTMAAQVPNFDIVDTFADGFQTTANNYAQAAQAHATAAQNHAQHVATVILELKKYRNVAAPDFQSLVDSMEQISRDMNLRFDAIDNRFDSLDTKMQAANFNSMARIQNSHLGQDTDALARLHKWLDDSLIAGHPNTVGDIKTMRNTDLISVLGALGAPIPATVGLPAKREGVRIALGVKPPVI